MLATDIQHTAQILVRERRDSESHSVMNGSFQGTGKSAVLPFSAASSCNRSSSAWPSALFDFCRNIAKCLRRRTAL